jgi:hypothetical protein
MSGVFWSITAMSLICTPEEVKEKMGLDDIVEWVFNCYDEDTGKDFLFSLSRHPLL